MKRPPIPAALERAIKTEAGYRCAIPMCRQTPVEIAHIIPWVKTKTHEFENLIALCPTCHSRYDRGEIDRQAIRQYKANLGILNGRYIDFERRILELFAEQPDADRIRLPGGFDVLVLNLLRDELLIPAGETEDKLIADWPIAKDYSLTLKGREFINKWLSNMPLD